MDPTALPFHRLLGLRPADAAGFLLELPDRPELADHPGTVHASALLALAEATSAALLSDRFGAIVDRALPLVRRVDATFHRPASGTLRGRATVDDAEAAAFVERLQSRGRTAVVIHVEVVDGDGRVVLTAAVEWSAQKVELLA